MITKEQKNAFKEVLGHRYAVKVKAHMDYSGLKNANGDFYSTASIRNTMNGNDSNSLITDIIIKVYKKEKKKLEDIKNLLAS